MVYVFIVLAAISLVVILFSIDFQKRKTNYNELVDVEINIDAEFIENANDIYDVIEPLDSLIYDYEGEEVYDKVLENVTSSQAYIFAIKYYRAEVNNGGHDQFYFNTAGSLFEVALEGLKEIGLKKVYDILKESADRLGGKPSKDQSKRWEQLEESNADFEDLDDKFYKLEQSMNIDNILFDFVFNNPSDFYFKGTIK